MQKSHCYAVVTGDLVKSTRLPKEKLESVRKRLLSAAKQCKTWQTGLVKGSPDFFRGDAWQLLLNKPEWALRVGVFIRARLLAQGIADTRLAIGIGTVDNISQSRISLSTGQAFQLSGRALDAMTQHTRLSIALPENAFPLREWMPVVGQLCDALIRPLTKRQAQIVSLAISPFEPRHEDIAKQLRPSVSKQLVTKTLQSANWNSLKLAIDQFQKTSWQTFVSDATATARRMAIQAEVTQKR